MEKYKEYAELVSLFDKQLQFAQNIQKKIIPKPHSFYSDHYHLFAYLKPFRKVGGDFYDFHSLDDEQISLILADATGHGIDAAMITSVVKLIYTYGMKDPQISASPSRLMQQIEMDIEQQLTSTFFSAITLHLDPRKKTLKYSNSGHPDAVIITSEGIELLKPTLPLLGLHQMMSHVSYEDLIHPFKQGDKLLLFTDGLLDAQNDAGESFSMERLLEFIEPRKEDAVTNLCNQIIAMHNTFKENTESNDDICLLGLEFDN